MQVENAEESLRIMFPPPSVAMLKQVIFNHMLSRETHDEADDRIHSGATYGQQGGAGESSVSGPSADPQGEITLTLRGQTVASDTTKQNGEAANRKSSGSSPLLTCQTHIEVKTQC